MIKYTFQLPPGEVPKLPNGGLCVGLVLSEENLRRLRKDQPIGVYLAELGIPSTILYISYAETEQEAIDNLRIRIGPDTLVHDKEKQE